MENKKKIVEYYFLWKRRETTLLNMCTKVEPTMLESIIISDTILEFCKWDKREFFSDFCVISGRYAILARDIK